MAEKFSHLRKETDIQIQKAQRIPNKINLKEAHAKDIINVIKVKEIILKAAGEK